MSKRLWEVDHPYYCTEGCYYVGSDDFRDVHAEWESWEDFINELSDADLDMNLLFRWDWEVPDPDDYEDEPVPGERVLLFMYGQRKAKPMSHTITVTREDEPIIREYLRVRAEHLRKVWEPLLDEPQP
jgi:hypothetical protein